MDRVYQDIKAAIPRELNAVTYGVVEESLKTCLKALKDTDTDDMCFKRLKRGFMLLITEVMRLWASTDPKPDGDIVVNLILECLSVINDHGVKSSSYAASLITSVCVDVLFKDTVSYLTRIEILSRLNIIFESIDPTVKQTLIETGFLKPNIYRLFQLVLNVGDYEFQVGLVEFMFRLVPQRMRERYSAAMIGDPKIRKAFLAMKHSCFEGDCRKFLNQVNRDQGTNRKVFSYPCSSITYGIVQLQKPTDMGYDNFWLDINMTTKRIIILCENAQWSSQASMDEESWETVYIQQSDIIKCVCEEEDGEQHIKLYVKSSASCVPKGCFNGSVIILHAYISLLHDVKAALAQFLGNKVPCMFLCGGRDGDQSGGDQGCVMTHQSDQAHNLAEIGSHSQEQKTKTSEPSETMTTSAMFINMEAFLNHPAGVKAKSKEAQTGSSSRKTQSEKKSKRSHVTPRRSRTQEARSPSTSCKEVIRKSGSTPEPADLLEKSSKTESGSQRQIPSDMSSHNRNKKIDEKKPAAICTQSGDTNSVQNCTDNETMELLMTSPKSFRCANYVLRNCSNRLSRSRERAQVSCETELTSKRKSRSNDRAQISCETETSSKTVEAPEINSKQLHGSMRTLREDTLTVLSRNKTEQKPKDTVPQYLSTLNKTTTTIVKKTDLAKDGTTSRQSESATGEISVKKQQLSKNKERRSEINTAGQPKLDYTSIPEPAADKKTKTKDKLSTPECSGMGQQKLDNSSSLGVGPLLTARQQPIKGKYGKIESKIVSQPKYNSSSHWQASPAQKGLHQSTVSRQKNQRGLFVPLSPPASGEKLSEPGLPLAETYRSYQTEADDTDDDTDMSLVIEIEPEPLDATQVNFYDATLNQSLDTDGKVVSGRQENERHVLENKKKNELSDVMNCQLKTPVTSSGRKIQDGCSTSTKKTAHWKSPVSVTHGYEHHDDSVTSISDSDRFKTKGERQQTSDSVLKEGRSSSCSEIKCVRKPNSAKSGQKHGNKSKQKHTADGSASRLDDSQVQKESAKIKGVSDDNSAFSAKKLRERVRMSYREYSGSSDELENITVFCSSIGRRSDSSLLPKITSSSKPKYSVDSSTQFGKGKRAKDSSKKNYHVDRSSFSFSDVSVKLDDGEMMELSDDDNMHGENDNMNGDVGNGCKTPSSLKSYLSPIKFVSTWSELSGNSLYQITPRDKNDSKKDKQQAVSALTSAREQETADRQERPVSGSSRRNTPKAQKNGRQSTHRYSKDSSVAGDGEKSEVSWIIEYKTNKKHLKGNKKYGFHSSHRESFSPEYKSEKISKTLRKEESMMVFSPILPTLHFDSPLNLSAETVRGAHSKSAENSDVDEKASLKSKTPRTSVCGSAVSECSILIQFSQHRTSTQADVDEADPEEFQLPEEICPVPSPNITELQEKTASDKGFIKISSKNSICDNYDENVQLLKKSGLRSGPSSIVRPRKSVLLRKFASSLSPGMDDDSDDDDDGIPKVKRPCLQPIQLFPEAFCQADAKQGTSAEKRTSNLAEKRTQSRKAAQLQADWASDMSDEEVPVPVAETLSQLEITMEQPCPSITTVIKGFGLDLQQHIKAQEQQVQQLTSGALKLTHRRVNQLWTDDRKQWEQVNEFSEHLEVELSKLEQEVADLNNVEKKTRALYLEILKLLRDNRTRLQEGVESSKKCYGNWRLKSELFQSHTRVQDLEIQLKQDMELLRNKVLLDMQHQQLSRVRESIKKRFF